MSQPVNGTLHKLHLLIGNNNVQMRVADTARRKPVPVGHVDETFFAEQLTVMRSPSSGLLPPAVRWISQTGRQVIFERPPRIARIRFGPNCKGSTINNWKTYDLPLPWTVYAVTLSQDYSIRSLSLYGCQGQLKSLNSIVGYLPLPNIYEDGHFCLPTGMDGNYLNDYEDEEEEDDDGWYDEQNNEFVPCSFRPPPAGYGLSPLADAINRAYQMIWTSDFNMDLWDLTKVALGGGVVPLLVPNPVNWVQDAIDMVPAKTRLIKFFQQWEATPHQSVIDMAYWLSPMPVASVVQSLRQASNQMMSPYSLMTSLSGVYHGARAREIHEAERTAAETTAQEGAPIRFR